MSLTATLMRVFIGCRQRIVAKGLIRDYLELVQTLVAVLPKKHFF